MLVSALATACLCYQRFPGTFPPSAMPHVRPLNMPVRHSVVSCLFLSLLSPCLCLSLSLSSLASFFLLLPLGSSLNPLAPLFLCFLLLFLPYFSAYLPLSCPHSAMVFHWFTLPLLSFSINLSHCVAYWHILAGPAKWSPLLLSFLESLQLVPLGYRKGGGKTSLVCLTDISKEIFKKGKMYSFHFLNME